MDFRLNLFVLWNTFHVATTEWVVAHPSVSWPLHPLLLPAWFASITTAPFLPKTCVPLSSLHIYSCQKFGLEMTSPASQTFLFYTLKSLWNLARLPKLSLSSLVTLLNIKHFYCIKPCWKEKGKKGKGKKANPCTQCEGRGRYYTGMDQVFVVSWYHLPRTRFLLALTIPPWVSPTLKNPVKFITEGVVSRLIWRVWEMGKPIPLLILLHHLLKRKLISELI